MCLLQCLQAAYRSALQVRKLVMKGKGKSQGLVSTVDGCYESVEGRSITKRCNSVNFQNMQKSEI